MAFCTNCGAKLDEGAKFCPNCGAGVGETVGTVAPVTGKNKSEWQYFCGVWSKYAVFSGRARRAEYWWFVLFSTIIWVGLRLIETGLGLNFSAYAGLLTVIYELAVLLPSWGVMVRRFHDVDRRAWCFLVPIYNIILLCTAGTAGPNRFGPDPKLEH
jgi:uncharacterized membrane protein YhaH (DUF805 family)